MPSGHDILVEVLDEIDSSLKDSRGIVVHQRRLAFSLSLGVVVLIENYLLKLNVLKGGAKINHLWFKKNRDNIKKLLSNQITCPIQSINGIDEILDVAFTIEKERNNLAYGKLVSENILKENINLFLKLKKKIGK